MEENENKDHQLQLQLQPHPQLHPQLQLTCSVCGGDIEKIPIEGNLNDCFVKCLNCATELTRLLNIESTLFALRISFAELEQKYNTNASTLSNIRGLTRI